MATKRSIGTGTPQISNFFLYGVMYVDLETHSNPLQLQPLLPTTIASLSTTQKHFDWAA